MKKMYTAERLISPELLAQIKNQVMLVYGDKDIIKLEHGLEIYRAISRSEFCILPDTTHEVFSVKPGLINKIAMVFLKKERKN